MGARKTEGNGKLKIMGIHTVQATANDAGMILELQKTAYQSEAKRYNDYRLPPLIQTFDEILKDFRKGHIKGCTFRSEVGSVRGYAENGTCYVGRLIVNPGFQKQGIGTKLMQHIENRFSDAKRYELFTGHKSEEALSLYKKLGYSVFKQKELSTYTLVYLEKVVSVVA